MRPSLLCLLRSLFYFLFLYAQRCPRVLIRVPFGWIFFLLYTCCSSKNGRKMENQGSSIFLQLIVFEFSFICSNFCDFKTSRWLQISSAISSIFQFDQDRFFTHEI
ncbi:hypothetical protein D8674_026149 [Pyrus ussuriensis x Pyrus communis]|uniref:Uncharacterized protein n=1 Tax=Pyrus ussuriensis x Pyrus communis TaxID=2448454 RepID=A0A5N5I614_9ROSA|nr:hypothetical protein D8674_038084 [Pyrus ussuriensis x Pyrus communis]KAB2635615.1 hypothetical protein D8674_026149 [Pyrus ussuriensis x Pyrus communis]